MSKNERFQTFDHEFSQPWMARWLEQAAESNRATEICKKVGISMSDYLLGRSRDAAFDLGCLVFEQIQDLQIRESVRIHAIDGDARAVNAYFRWVRLPCFVPEFASWKARSADETNAESPHPEIAEAAMEAALRKSAELEDRGEIPPGSTAASRLANPQHRC